MPSDPGEVWTLDEAGLVVRWPQVPTSEKHGRAQKGHFSTAGREGHAMAVCGKHVWIGTGDTTEVRDFGGKLAWKIARYSSAFVDHGTMDAVWCAGNDGSIVLYKNETVEMQVQLNFRPPVNNLLYVVNPGTGEAELWASQGRVLTVVSETSGKVLLDLPSSVESKINEMVAARASVWVGCDDGRVVRMNVAERAVQQSIQTMEGPCWGVLVSASRLWACGTGRNVRLFDVETGAPLETIVNAHEDGGVTALVLVESAGKLCLWTCGSDKSVAVWNAGVEMQAARKQGNLSTSSLVPLGRDDSDEFDDSTSDAVERKSSGVDLSRSPRFGLGGGEGRSPRMQKPTHGSASGSASPSRQSGTSSPVLAASLDEEVLSEEGVRSSGSLPARKKSAGKKRVVGKLFLAAQAASVEKLIAVMQSIDTKHGGLEEEKLAARRKALDGRGPNRRTALHVAAMSGKIECVQLLLDWGANIAIKDKSDMYALNLAGSTDIKALLLQLHMAGGLDTGGSSGGGDKSKNKHLRTKSVAVTSSERGGSSRIRVAKKKSGMAVSGLPTQDTIPQGGAAARPRSPRSNSATDVPSAASPRPLTPEPAKPAQASPIAPPPSAIADAAAVPATMSEPIVATEAMTRCAVRIQSYVRMKSAKAEAVQLQAVRTKRKNIGLEMLKTEETYVKTLDVLVNKIRVSMSTQSFRTAAGGVSEADMKIIFPASLSMLLSAHESWLGQLRARIEQWSPLQCVGDLFLQLSPYLKMYIVYVSNFELSTLKIRELRKRDKKFVELVHEVFVNLGDPTNDLASMLVTPVQRIPRYVMMLKDLLKHTSTQHPDYNNLLKAVKIMTDTTVLVDRKAEDAKNAQKVLEVADSIVESPLPIVQPNRKWVKDGPVGLIVGPGEVRPRYAFLFTDVLLLCAPVEPPKKGNKKEEAAAAAAAVAAGPAAVKPGAHYRFQRELSLLSASVHSIKDDDASGLLNLLVVQSPKLAFVVQTQSAADKAAWIKGIVSVIELRKAGSMSLQNTNATPRTTGTDFLSRSSASVPPSASRSSGKKSASADEDAEGRVVRIGGVKSEESESTEKSFSHEKSK